MRDGAVIFDLDDTLYPYRAFVGSGFRAVAAAAARLYGVDAGLALRQLRRARVDGHRGRELQRSVLRPSASDGRACELHRVMVDHRPSLRLPTASRAVLDALRGRWRLGVLTNGDAVGSSREGGRAGVAPLVDAVVFACEHGDGSGKPAPEGFGEVLARLEHLAGAGGLRRQRSRHRRRGRQRRRPARRSPAPGLARGAPAPRAAASVRSLLDVPGWAARLLAREEPPHVV